MEKIEKRGREDEVRLSERDTKVSWASRSETWYSGKVGSTFPTYVAVHQREDSTASPFFRFLYGVVCLFNVLLFC